MILATQYLIISSVYASQEAGKDKFMHHLFNLRQAYIAQHNLKGRFEPILFSKVMPIGIKISLIHPSKVFNYV